MARVRTGGVVWLLDLEERLCRSLIISASLVSLCHCHVDPVGSRHAGLGGCRDGLASERRIRRAETRPVTGNVRIVE